MKIRFARSLSLSSLALSSLGLSMGFLQPVSAQTVAEPDLTVITVTATRITRDGYSAPTPLTVFGEEDLERAGQINAFTAANQLPSLAGSNSTSTFGTTQSTTASARSRDKRSP